MTVDPQTFKQTLAQWASGVTVVTTCMEDGSPKGMTASAFSSVSAEPPLILVCISKNLLTHDVIAEQKVFAVNILKQGQEHWGKLFAGMFPEVEDRFADIATTTAETGAPILPDVLGWLDCRVHNQVDGGSHTIFIGEVLAAHGTEGGGNPLMYYNRAWGTFQPDPTKDA